MENSIETRCQHLDEDLAACDLSGALSLQVLML